MKKRLENLVEKFKKKEVELLEILNENNIIFDETQEKSVVKKNLKDYIKKVNKAKKIFEEYEVLAKEIEAEEMEGNRKSNIKRAIDLVACELGNTSTVCRKYYIHPLIINMYENDSIKKYLRELDEIEVDDGKTGLTKEEEMVMKILKTEKL